jgi:hypothetical protein
MILSLKLIAFGSLPGKLGGFYHDPIKDLDFTLHANQNDYNSDAYHNYSGRIDK